MDTKFFLLGLLLLAFGIAFIWGYFTYPESFYGVGLAGILAGIMPFIALLLGIGFIYASFSREPVPPLAPQTDVLMGERIHIEGAQRVEHETSICKQHLGPGEKLSAIMLGEVEGIPELDRLALTDKQVIFYSSNNLKNAVTFEYGQIETVDGKTGKVLTHLGQIDLSARGTKITFRNMLQEYVKETMDKISKARQKV